MSRVKKFRKEAEAKGWKRREYYATPEEHAQLKQRLQQLREGKS